MEKYVFYAQLLMNLIFRLDFSITAVMQVCIKLKNRHPDKFHPRFLLAELYRSEGQNEAARMEYRQLIESGFVNEKVMFGLAKATLRDKLFDDAAEYFQRTLAINQRNKEAIDQLGRIYSEKGVWEEAIKYFEQSLHMDPNNALILENAAYCYYYLGAYQKSYDAYHAAYELTQREELLRDMNRAKSKLA